MSPSKFASNPIGVTQTFATPQGDVRMSQPEIWVSISIRGGQDGADQPPAKVLDLKITAAPTGDVGTTSTTMLAAPRHPQAAQARPISSNVWEAEPGPDVTGQIPVVNIVLGDTDETA